MTDTRFDVYFSGQLAVGTSPQQAASQLARLFRTEPERLAHLFTGQPVVVKRDVSRDQAVKYRQALSQAGMTSVFRPHGEPAPAPAPAQPSAPVPNGRPAEPSVAAITTSPPPAPGMAAAAIEAGDASTFRLSLAPVGSDVLQPSERRQVEPVSVDLSGLSLAPPGEDLLRPEERQPAPAVDIDTSGLRLA